MKLTNTIVIMYKWFIFITVFAIITCTGYSQRPVMELTFTVIDSAAYVKFDSGKLQSNEFDPGM